MTNECRPELKALPNVYTVAQLNLALKRYVGGMPITLPTVPEQLPENGYDISSFDLEGTAAERFQGLIQYNHSNYSDESANLLTSNWHNIRNAVIAFRSAQEDVETDDGEVDKRATDQAKNFIVVDEFIELLEPEDIGPVIVAMSASMELLGMMGNENACVDVPMHFTRSEDLSADEIKTIYTVAQLHIALGGIDGSGSLADGQLPQGGLDISDLDFSSPAAQRFEKLIGYDSNTFDEETSNPIQRNYHTIKHAVSVIRDSQEEPEDGATGAALEAYNKAKDNLSSDELTELVEEQEDQFNLVVGLQSLKGVFGRMQAEIDQPYAEHYRAIAQKAKVDHEIHNDLSIPAPPRGWGEGAQVKVDGVALKAKTEGTNALTIPALSLNTEGAHKVEVSDAQGRVIKIVDVNVTRAAWKRWGGIGVVLAAGAGLLYGLRRWWKGRSGDNGGGTPPAGGSGRPGGSGGKGRPNGGSNPPMLLQIEPPPESMLSGEDSHALPEQKAISMIATLISAEYEQLQDERYGRELHIIAASVYKQWVTMNRPTKFGDNKQHIQGLPPIRFINTVMDSTFAALQSEARYQAMQRAVAQGRDKIAKGEVQSLEARLDAMPADADVTKVTSDSALIKLIKKGGKK